MLWEGRPDRSHVLRITRKILLAAFLVTVAVGCGRRDNTVEDAGPETLYTKGKDAMDASNYTGADPIFHGARVALSVQPRDAPGAARPHISLLQEPAARVRGRRRREFERENPTHPRVDYCLYMKGRVWFDQAPNILERMFKVDLSVRPPKDTLKSFSTFQELIRRFPDSEYVPDARQRMVFLRNRLAQYENHVAEYYIERGAYVAAVNRAKYALEHYPGAPDLEQTLHDHGGGVREARYEGLRGRRAPRAARKPSASRPPQRGREALARSVAGGDRVAPVASERAIADAHARRRLPALVLRCASPSAARARRSRGRSRAPRSGPPSRSFSMNASRIGIEHVVRRQRVAVLLVVAQLGGRRRARSRAAGSLAPIDCCGSSRAGTPASSCNP